MKKIEPFVKLNIKYSDFWINKCPPEGNVKYEEIEDNSYLNISESDFKIYSAAGKEWLTEITGFVKSNGYIIEKSIGKGPNTVYFELTERGRIVKDLQGHSNYILSKKFQIKDKYPVLFSLGLVVFGSILTIITSRLTNQSKSPELPPIYMYQNARIEALHDSVKTLQLNLQVLLDSLRK